MQKPRKHHSKLIEATQFVAAFVCRFASKSISQLAENAEIVKTRVRAIVFAAFVLVQKNKCHIPTAIALRYHDTAAVSEPCEII